MVAAEEKKESEKKESLTDEQKTELDLIDEIDDEEDFDGDTSIEARIGVDEETNRAAYNFEKALIENEIKYTYLEDEEAPLYRISYNLENTNIVVFINISNDQEDIHLEGMDFVKIPNGKEDIAIEMCNQINTKYRWVKFIWEEGHSELRVRMDNVINADVSARVGLELIYRMTHIVDDCYPEFMKAIWC